MRFELTRNSYTIVKCVSFVTFHLARSQLGSFSKIIRCRCSLLWCFSRFCSQAPPVSYINLIVLIASLASSVVAVFGLLISVLETKLEITSVWGAPVGDSDVVIPWSERVESIESHNRRILRALALVSKLAPAGDERDEIESTIASMGVGNFHGGGEQGLSDASAPLLTRSDDNIDTTAVRRRSHAVYAHMSGYEPPVIGMLATSSSSESRVSHVAIMKPANSNALLSSAPLSLPPSSPPPLPWSPGVTAITGNSVGIEMHFMMDGADEVVDPRK